MDTDGFLKLFVAQLQHQDPNSPMDTADSMNQMASFSMVEQITAMAQREQQHRRLADTVRRRQPDRPLRDLHGHRQASRRPARSRRVVTGKDGTASLTIAGTAGINPTSITQVA